MKLRRILVGSLAMMLLASSQHLQAASPVEHAPQDWPMDTSIRRTLGQRQVLLFANPYDYGTRAAIYRAVELSARSGAPCTVCLVGPEGAAEDWFDTPLAWTATRNGLRVHRDAGGGEARRFAVSTSGVCLAYDARGRLCFLGDLTQQSSQESTDAGVKAALDGLSHSREKLIVRPALGRPLAEG